MTMEFLTYVFWENPVKDYLIAFGAFLISVIILRIFKYFIIQKIKKIASKTKTEIDDFLIRMIDNIDWPFYFMLSLYIGFLFLKLPTVVTRGINYAAIIVVTFYVTKSIGKLIDIGKEKLIKRKKLDKSRGDLFAIISKIILWVIGGIFVISNLGFDVATLIAGLGIGGIAIGFALKNVLDDVFASFSIYLDEPFERGDFIIIGEDMGVVKKIGIKTTRIQTLEGQELIVSNKELTNTRINNYKKMRKRRAEFNFGVKYETPTKKLKKIPKWVTEIINNVEGTEADRVHFSEFGDYALNFSVVIYLDEPDYDFYMDVQQEINLKIKEKFEKNDIEFAYPTQKVFLEK
jgi:small-conductance mechanosensitive channel